ncbi:uncharacterized protein B0T15DRAFT_569218 [Chaetomium strumarium]|uniref:F-box domain-containing protein n=1 Tax=Chaetomium strumarium TaxID=1170767 RepID=A0AAJ0LZW7_9PEZI|nr:hypothetical protein B0T15DRAFT_569218 [Chaetomium strumarium]
MHLRGEPSHLAPLERLPLHILDYICKYVPRRSLFSLSMVSRLCYQAATPGRFARVRFVIHDDEKLHWDLQQWTAILGRESRFRHVRRVVVVGLMNDPYQAGDLHRMTGPEVVAIDNDNSDGDESDSDSDVENVGFNPGGPTLSPGHKQAQHEAWLPFAQFLSKLPGLTDLVYSCTHQVPACVLTALHNHHPKSRLHMSTFSLRSLYQERDQLCDIDADDIRTVCEPYDVHGRYSFNSEALDHIIMLGCAPGLRQLHIHGARPGNSLALVQSNWAPREPWRGFFRESSNQPSAHSLQPLPKLSERARLETLVLSGLCDARAWVSRTRFDALSRFELYCGVSVQVLQTLASMAADNKFPCLRELGLTVSPSEYSESDPASLEQPAGLFLQAVPPLRALTLGDCFSRHTFTTVLFRHGQSLHKLHLYLDSDDDEHDDAGFDAGWVREIQQRCPRLEDVRLPVRRRQGGAEEVAVYQTLGQLPRLRRATLLLDPRAPRSDPLTGDVGGVRKTLVNLAVDEQLARAIFWAISSAATAPLQRLRLETRVEDVFAERYWELQDWARWIGRSWVCTRREPLGEVVVREIGDNKAKREVGNLGDELQVLRDELEQFEYDLFDGTDVWNELWPRRAEDWRDDWHSFPLSGSGGRYDG